MKNLIPATDFCTSHNIEFSLLYSFQESGLIEITTIKETGYIRTRQLPELERMIRLHEELDINPEGIETIFHLLNRINSLKYEITFLRNRLRFYETDE